MSDDGWYGGESQEPVTGSDPYGRGRRAAGVRQQYPEQQASGYSEQQYTQDPYPQGYASESGQGYYQDPNQPGGSQDWHGSRSGYSQAEYASPDYPTSGYTQPDYTRREYSQPEYSQPEYSQPEYRQPDYSQPDYSQSGSYSQPGYAQPEQDYNSSSTYGRPSQASRPAAQQQTPTPQPYADPYAADPYASGTYSSDPYASGPRTSGSYGRQQQPQQPQQPRLGDPAQADYGSARRADGYSTGAYATASGASGASRRRPAASSDEYGTSEYGDRSSGEYGDGSSGEYGSDEFLTRPRRSGTPARDEQDSRASTRSEAARSEVPGRSSRRAVPPARDDDHDDDHFSLMDDEDDADGDGRRGGRKLKQKKGRNCLAVFVAFSVLAGGLGYGGYSAYKWYQSKYGAPPDYTSATGSGASIDVTIPTGAGGTTIGGILFAAGIVKSQRAFTDACKSNTNCANIESGTYLLPKGISAAASITDLLDPKTKDSKSQLITYGGERAGQIFAALEQKTGWKDADLQNIIATGNIDLPTWDTAKPGAKFPYAHIEGFIASESYNLPDFTNNPTGLLKKMVDDQLAVFSQENLAVKAQAAGESEYNMLIIASLARAEAGSNTSDLNKIAGVVFNRLKSTNFQHLGFDTATLYGMGNATTTPNNKDATNPYNTSVFGIKGLPPGPIDNPDQTSIDAALNPITSTFLFFCATPDGVQYATTATQWQQLGGKYPGLCGNR
ncbi:MAG TPA: endolytic transglycosylase MltG [Actinocrinis sp.]|uniref:endolytic transglycosylase MltG n=1 Tax=Actinocrinis sp. TaxID=1920516 RepID=UPI002DDDBD0D|nr:endolytic transglycosylase MltG [Actinocrinis sp.]HEV3169475.1 endolytic transglycosylase MltG [Actinocrinis sp.]